MTIDNNKIHYNHLIVGTGQALGTLLGKLILTKDSIGVIEADRVGGSCVNYGCTPTKTLVATAKVFNQSKKGDFYGFNAEKLELNFDKVRERMNSIRNGGNKGLTQWMEGTSNVDLMLGIGKFVGAKEIEVNGKRITADNIYLNVGTRPSLLPIPGLDQVNWLDSARLLDLETVPDHMIILGGGYIGVEFAQVFKRFGSKITLIQRSDQLMPREDADVANAVREFIEEEGVKVYTEANTKSVSQKDGLVEITIEHNGEIVNLNGDQLLVAAGRTPNSDTLNLESTNIKSNNRGYIEVDDYCETAEKGVYALGDVNGHGGFTHTAVNDAEIVLDKLFGGDRKLSERGMIYGLFTDPPLGRVGMSEKEALKSGKRILKAVKPMRNISRAKEMGETKGFVKILVDADTELILGASILGVGGDEIINMLATIMHSKTPYTYYRKIVLVHPTVSELIPWILDGLKEIE